MDGRTNPLRYWIGLSSIPGIGRTTFRRLVSRFGSPQHAFAATRDDLKSVDRLSDAVIDDMHAHTWREFAERELTHAREASVAIITEEDHRYPEQLRKIPDAPLYLYVRGTLTPDDGNAIAIVGTRRPTQYGLTMTRRIAHALASAGCTIISGMARGIDTSAHRGALAAQGRTIAVLGSGIDVPYPPENRGLMNEIIESGRGAVISENPFGTQPEPGYFPARNRIISGLAHGTVIIEASSDSGSLITADYTVKQGRKLFAVPGNIGSPVSRGPNNLIRQGAVLVECAQDILSAIPGARMDADPKNSRSETSIVLTDEEDSVFRRVTCDPKHIDVIMSEAGMTAGRINGILMTLELKGLVRQLSGKYYIQSEHV